MADLTTLANAKSWLGIAAAGDDALLTRLVSSASDFIQQWLNRTIASTSYTDTFDGKNGRKWAFANYPVTAIASVVIDGLAIPAASSPLSAGYSFSRSMLFLNSYQFSYTNPQNCVINYTAGYSVIPNEVEQACIELIGIRYRSRERIGMVSKSAGGESISFIAQDLSGAIEDVLQQYKKVHTS